MLRLIFILNFLAYIQFRLYLIGYVKFWYDTVCSSALWFHWLILNLRSSLLSTMIFTWSEMKVAQLFPSFCEPMDCIVHGILQARIVEWVAFPFSRGSSQPRDQTQASLAAALQVDSLPAEPPGKPKNTGVGSLSLLQWIFPTQESNRAVLNCRQILYQLSYQGSPLSTIVAFKGGLGLLGVPRPLQRIT